MTQRPDSYYSTAEARPAMDASPETKVQQPPAIEVQQQARPEPSEQERLGMMSLEISIALSGKETLDDTLAACTDTLVHHLNASLARIWLLHAADNTLELAAGSGRVQGEALHARISTDSTPNLQSGETARIANQRQPRIIHLEEGEPHESDHAGDSTLQQWMRGEGVETFAGYPLLVREDVVGVLELFIPRVLSSAASQVLATISNGIAMAIERTQMLEERTRLLRREHAAHIEAEIARQRLQDLFMQAPAIICVLRGPEHVHELANPPYLELIGRQDILGKTVREVAPELVEQGYEKLLDRVYQSSEPFEGKELPGQIKRHGKVEDAYFNFVYRPTRNSAGEVDGILVHAMEVTEQVRAREVLRGNQERLLLAQRSGHIGTFEWTIALNHILWTPELEALYGLPPGGFEGKYENWANRVHPDDLAAAEKNLQEAVAGGPPYDVEFRVIWPDGTLHWMHGQGILDYDEQGRPWRVIGVNIDVTERKEAERQLNELYQSLQHLNATLEAQVLQRTEALNQTNLELQRSNNELQEFAYVASHDLQEPLRKIQAFGNLLQEEYGEVVGEGSMYIERMRSAAARMRVLIDDLLAFSRVTTKAQPFVPVDLNAVAQQVVEDLGPRLESTGGSIELGELPTIDADPQQMYQMLQNLFSNAVKFHKPDLPPLVKVSAQFLPASLEPTAGEDEPRYLLRIEDNGIGFDEKYTDRIFTVFQRLHGKEKYEGTGIGLAVVRKIVERHRGTVVAHSSLGQGATFLVTLPAHTH